MTLKEAIKDMKQNQKKPLIRRLVVFDSHILALATAVEQQEKRYDRTIEAIISKLIVMQNNIDLNKVEQQRRIEAIEKRQIELVDILNTYPDKFATKKQLKPKKAR